MNILYLSKLTGNLFAGPNYSVPAQIFAQSKIDNVFWYNLNQVKREEWQAAGCNNLTDYPSGRLKDLPAPFNEPDLVVVEEFYCHLFSKIIMDVQKRNIPYIIIPRSQMTAQSAKKGKLKKVVARWVFLNSFVCKSAAIQYLSEEEREESEPLWRKQGVVIPNGVKIREKSEPKRFGEGIHAVYIGRYERYQKGLDILIAAISDVQTELREAGFQLSMYGVDQGNTVENLREEISKNALTDLIAINGSVFENQKDIVLKEADVFVLTSRFEGHPMALVEALSYSLPCIVTKGSNMKEEIEANGAGWGAENDAESVAEAIRKMLADREKFEKISENAYNLAGKYDWNQIARNSHLQYLRILEQ